MVAYIFHILKMNVIAAAVIVLAVLTARFTKKKYSAKWKYFMWMAIAIFLLVPVNFSGKSFICIQIDEPSERLPAQQMEKAVPTKDAPKIQKTEKLSEGGITQLSVKLSSKYVSVYGVLEGFGVIWLTGVFLLVLIRGLRYYFSLHKMVRWSYPVEDKCILEMYRWLCVKKHIRRSPALLISPGLSTPVLAGVRHTGVYLTEEEYDLEELRFILSHELSHYKRRDLWYKMLLMAVGTLYWFNPALYWMQSEAEKDIENLCDSSVIEKYTQEEQQRYGRLLLKTAAMQNHVPYLTASLNDSTLIFKERILYMRNMNHLKSNVLSVVLLLMVMLGGQFLVGSTVKNAVSGARVSAWEITGSDADVNAKDLPDFSEPVNDKDTSNARGIPRKQSTWDGQGSSGQSMPDLQDSTYILDEENSPDIVNEPGVPDTQNAENSQEISDTQNTVNVQNSSGIQNPLEAQGDEELQNEGTGADVSAGTGAYTITDQQITLYETQGNGATYVNLATDGNWYDGVGWQYAETGQGQWICLNTGEKWTDVDPDPLVKQSYGQVLVKDGGAYNQQTLYQQEDGSWKNMAGGVYTSNGDGSWTGPDGTFWYGNY